MDLRSYLDRMDVDYRWSRHSPAFTAQDLAMAEHVSGKRVIKPVVVEADGAFVLCALPASYFIDIEQLRQELHAEDAHIADEKELGHLFRNCDLGAEPPIGNLFGIPTVMDDSLKELDRVTFQAGTHEDAVTISMADYLRLARPVVAHFGRSRD